MFSSDFFANQQLRNTGMNRLISVGWKICKIERKIWSVFESFCRYENRNNKICLYYDMYYSR